jgi:hypothetical protein
MANALKHPGQGVSVPSESTEFLAILNAMMDGLKIENLLIPYTARTIVPVVQGQKVYGVGPGQDWGISSDGITPFERPEKIHRAGFLIPGSGNPGCSGPAELQMHIVLTFEEYARYVIKNVQSNYPYVLYYQAATPFGAATLYPVPNQDGTIAIYTPQLVSEYLTFDDILLVRDGWREMLIYNLAEAIHEVPPYSLRPMAPSITPKAALYKQRVKANQLTPINVKSDPGATQNRYGLGRYSGFPREWTPYS